MTADNLLDRSFVAPPQGLTKREHFALEIFKAVLSSGGACDSINMKTSICAAEDFLKKLGETK
jgi:hypothetical protein